MEHGGLEFCIPQHVSALSYGGYCADCAEHISKALVLKRERQFMEKSIEEFMYLLHNEAWEDIFLCNDINTSFSAFMSMFIYYFKRAFPLKTVYFKVQYENK